MVHEINYINLERQNKVLKKQIEFFEEEYENIKNRELDWEYLLDKENIIPRLRKDIELAKESILIYASFYTENMINYWKPILEKKIKEGVKVKCFARAPSGRSTEKFINIKKLIDIGVIVDFEDELYFRQYFENNDKKVLRCLNSSYPEIELDSYFEIRGCIVQQKQRGQKSLHYYLANTFNGEIEFCITGREKTIKVSSH